MSSFSTYEIKSTSDRVFLKKTMSNIKLSPAGIIVIVCLGALSMYYLHRNWDSKSDGQDIAERSNLPSISMKELLSASIYLAEKGGVEVKKIRAEADLHEKSKGKTREGVNNPVTDGDMKSHEAIVHGLQVLFKDLRIISEEHEEKKWDPTKVEKVSKSHPDVNSRIDRDQMIPLEDITVWVDPLDATKEYTENLLQYVTVMVCVAVKGKPTIGVIHKPFKEDQQTTWAWAGYGRSENLKAPSYDKDSKTSPKIIVSLSHAGTVKDIAQKAFGESVEVIGAGGAGYKVLSLFEGVANAYIHVTLIKKWDICAGNALLREMNSKMTTLDGEEIDYSHNSDPKNEGGLLATIWFHDFYLEKLKPILNQKKGE